MHARTIKLDVTAADLAEQLQQTVQYIVQLKDRGLLDEAEAVVSDLENFRRAPEDFVRLDLDVVARGTMEHPLQVHVRSTRIERLRDQLRALLDLHDRHVCELTHKAPGVYLAGYAVAYETLITSDIYPHREQAAAEVARRNAKDPQDADQRHVVEVYCCPVAQG
jgi:hypothetical protein